MGRPRILLIPQFTELEWEPIVPQLEQWAEVASFDLPGVGDEPLPPDREPGEFDRRAIVERGLRELDDRGWSSFFIAADAWGIAAAVRIAEARRDELLGLILGHAALSYRREGDRAPVSGSIHDALTQLLQRDHEAFVRYGIVQSTRGSVSEEAAHRMVERFPRELIETGWRVVTAEEPFGDALVGLDVPMLLAKHEGCVMSTEEGFDDAAAALPHARTLTVPVAPTTSPAFAEAIREFCEAALAKRG